MRRYRLTVYEPAAAVSLDFEAETDRDAVQLTSAAAAGQAGALWREGRLLLSLERPELAAGPWASWTATDPNVTDWAHAG
jgi:hypothetical protein